VLAVVCTASIAELTASSARGRWGAAAFLNALQVAAGMLMLSIAAASALGEERARGSLDVLLATPLSTWSIVWGKWCATFRAVPLLALVPGLATAAIARHHGHWPGVVLIVALVVAYGAFLTSLGLAVATWVPRLGRAVGLSVASHVGITVGWVVFIAMCTPKAPGLLGPGLASFSPFMGVLLPSIVMQFSRPGEYSEALRWIALWTAIDAALAAALLTAVLVTFNRCLGRDTERPWRARAGPGHVACN
jgi:ABC-type Na+ efflux pump permease subunit